MKSLDDMIPEELQDNGYMRPEELAELLNVTGRRLRQHLRNRYPRSPEEKGKPWYLNKKQIDEVVDFFYFNLSHAQRRDVSIKLHQIFTRDNPIETKLIDNKALELQEKNLKILKPIWAILFLVILIMIINQ